MGQYKGIMGGIDSMVANRFTPWHYSYNEDRVALVDLQIESGQQALTLAKCDWGVNLVGLGEFMPNHEGAEDFFLALRSDKQAVLGVHKERYTVIPNSAVGDMADAVMVAAPGSNIESAGSLYVPGKVVWVLVRLPDTGATFGGREHHERYILVTTSHDASLAFSVRGTDVRVECMNTMSMAYSGARAEYVVRHTTNALDYVREAQAGIATVTANWQAMDTQIAALIDTELSRSDFASEIIPEVIGEAPEAEGRGLTMWENRFDAIVEMYDAPHNEAIVDTAWGAVNAVNEFEEWGIKPRGQEVHEQQFKRLLTGSYDMTRKAMSLVS
jgi:phage/plasmid-like protein (TIGR03299 family)